ncbi:MAG: hypothetical protein WDZ35_08440 [Crocinitomicaceae bacterium]
MKGIFFISIALAITACGTTRGVVADNTHPDKDSTLQPDDLQIGDTDMHNVSITITHYLSYCGGMAPTQEMLDDLHHPQGNTNFILIDLNSGKRINVKTDSTGTLYLNLPPGKYGIREMYKDCTFEEFKEKHYKAPGNFYQERQGTDCYEKWWASNLGEFEILAGDPRQQLNWGTYDQCFIGKNPCVIYTGSYPP